MRILVATIVSSWTTARARNVSWIRSLGRVKMAALEALVIVR